MTTQFRIPPSHASGSIQNRHPGLEPGSRFFLPPARGAKAAGPRIKSEVTVAIDVSTERP